LLNQKEVKIMGQLSLSLSLSLSHSQQVIRERGESLTQSKDLLTLEKRQKRGVGKEKKAIHIHHEILFFFNLFFGLFCTLLSSNKLEHIKTKATNWVFLESQFEFEFCGGVGKK
jgi:hypothetical protein